MTTETPRRFGVADGLILMVGIAVGLAATRWLWLVVGGSLAGVQEVIVDVGKAFAQRRWSAYDLSYSAFALGAIGSILVVPSLATFTLAILVLVLRRPRPPWRRLVRRPGMMACFAVSLVFALSAILGLLLVVTTRGDLVFDGFSSQGLVWMEYDVVFPMLLMFGTLQAGAAVFWTWVAMALSRRWRAERSWTDRLGRLLGLLWMVLASLEGYLVLLCYHS
jgi:hypothetical protein